MLFTETIKYLPEKRKKIEKAFLVQSSLAVCIEYFLCLFWRETVAISCYLLSGNAMQNDLNGVKNRDDINVYLIFDYSISKKNETKKMMFYYGLDDVYATCSL